MLIQKQDCIQREWRRVRKEVIKKPRRGDASKADGCLQNAIFANVKHGHGVAVLPAAGVREPMFLVYPSPEIAERSD